MEVRTLTSGDYVKVNSQSASYDGCVGQIILITESGAAAEIKILNRAIVSVSQNNQIRLYLFKLEKISEEEAFLDCLGKD